ncbi:MAG: cell division protein FtsQ/DivIB [Bradyrhizobium sp.]|nr:cell division protein FtsQ/DivIB [Bradyrhizobium sp.]
MDGGGRLARSPRSPRQQADLMDAVLGAAAALRARLRPRSSAAKSRRNVRDEQPPRLIAFVERLPRRAGLMATLLLLAASAGLGIVKGGHLEAFLTSLSDTRNALANSAGFRITSVAINGRKQLSQDEVLAIGGVNGRSSLLFLDAAAVREKLKADAWISDATVLKLYPGQLRIDITERAPFALWQHDGRLFVISEDGAVLQNYVPDRLLKLPLVVGKGAATRARDFLTLLARYPQVRAVTKAAIFVGERRWNLLLNDGLDVRLPENDVSNALASLSNLDKDEHLFSKDIVAIDLRLPDRLIVQLSDEAAKAREDALKKKEPKKKVGDA